MIKKRFNKTVVIFILLTGIMHVAAAYYISGYVTDSSTGLPISNANVTANTSLSTTTDNTGFYNFTNISNGIYIVNASLAGYDTNSTNVTINGSDATDANISLSPLPAPTYTVSGYVFDNYGSGLKGVLVQNGSNQNMTLASGYYLVPGLSNGTYNFSYSKSGFNKGYSEVTINGADNISANITLYDTTPPASVSDINATAGNFYINNTWVNPADTDFNYTWFRYSNGTTLQNVSAPTNSLNLTWQPHYTQNISAQTVDNYGNVNQTMIWLNATIPNNAPVQAIIGNQTVYEGQWLNFIVSAIDADNDTITYGTNATKGTFNITTGNFSWAPNYGDAGFYFWNFNSSDGYGGITDKNITVTVINVPLAVTNSSPASDPATTVGVPQTFTIALNRTANITWYINGSIVQSNSSVTSADYTNSTAGIGAYNVTAIANDGYDSAGRTWNWTIIPQPVYAPAITSWGNSKMNDTNLTLVVNASESVNFNAIANQTITIWNWSQDSVNQNNNYDNFTTSWSTTGIKTIQVNATNANGTSNTITWNVSVQALPAIDIPPSPVNISSTTGNFWLNTTWQAGAGNVTDSYNISINGAWTNGTTDTYANSSLSAHAWQNVTVYSYNASGGGSLSISPATKNTQIPNNPPVQSSIGNKSVVEGQWLNFTVNATDIDNDTITYDTNSTKGSLNATTGNFSWLTTYSDAGTYVWYFNSSDGYGGVASETITVTVNNTPLSITSFSPQADPTTVQGDVQDFNITLDRAANVTWYMNGTPVQINTSTTSTSYTNSTAAAGTWNVTAGATDGIDIVSKTWNWTVNTRPPVTYTPPDPINLENTTGNFWVNHTWQTGAGNITDSYNISVNGIWYNGTIDTFENTTSAPHGWVNITVWAYNSSSTGTMSAGSISQNTQIPNNPPSQALIGNKTVDEGQILTFTVNTTDADNDTITYGTNATKGSLNSTTGQFIWAPGYGDAGVYNWYFNSSDGYGGVAGETITVTVNNVPLSVTNSSPASDPATTVGVPQTFTIALNRTANITWYINDSIVQSNTSVASADYTNSTAGIGAYNVTAIANDGYDSAGRIWNWTVIPQPTYSVSGYVFDNYGSGLGGILVKNESNQNTTDASGYYLITGLLNGTYNFSYSKAGFDTGYLEVTINGADNTSANTTIYDTTPPASVSNINTTTGNFYINNTWVNPADTDFNHIWFRYSNGTTLQNVSAPTNSLNLTWQPHYTQNISAQTVDNYSNINQTIVWFNTTIPNNAPFQYAIGDKVVNENENLQFNVTATDADNDTITYGTNATKGTFNTTTGNFSWTPGYGDAGVYFWNFNSSDGFGGVASETITVIVGNVPLSITSSSPAGDPTTTIGTAQTFGIALNRTANVIWYINGSTVQTNSSVISANYTNSTAGIGEYNVTATANDSYYSVSRAWNWTVIAQPTYNVSGYVFDNYSSGLGGVLVQNGSNQNTTIASGYYLITGLPNGTYNFSFSKAGFDTGYLEIAINGSDNTNANISLSPLPAPTYVISGYVMNSSTGLPISNVNMTTNTSLSTTTNSSGFYNFTGLSNGTYIVNASLTGYNTNSTNVTINGSDITNANISLSPLAPVYVTSGSAYIISGYATNASDGSPLSDVNMTTNTSLSTTTNASGFYNFTNLSNGTYIVNASLAGYDINSINVIINGSDVTNANISLSPLPAPAYAISGYVTNASSGLPLDNATVITNTSMSTTTNASGFYNFTGLSNGTYIVNASLAGYNTNSTNVTINGSDTINANISLSVSSGGGGSSSVGAGAGPGIGGSMDAGAGTSYNISGYVLDSYTLDGLGGADVTLNTTVNTSMQNTSNSTGFYIFTGLTNGSYNIKASLSGYPDNSTNVMISGADVTNASIYLTLSSTQCTDCHYSFSYMNSSGRPDLYVNQTQVNESVHAALDCKDCHTNTTVHPPPKSGWKWCEDCHANQQNPPTNKSRHNIVANPWNNLYNGISAVNITTCVTCHDPVLYNNSINTYGSESGIDCDYCHTFPDNVID